METAESVIKSALQEILVQASEAELEPDEIQDAITYMNRFMSGLAAKGINLGYTVVDNVSDPITIPDGAVEGLVLNLAIRLAPQFDRPVPIDLRISAKEAKDAMKVIAIPRIGPAPYPDTVPIGSGNEDNFTRTSHFYPRRSPGVLNEQTGTVLLEDETT